MPKVHIDQHVTTPWQRWFIVGIVLLALVIWQFIEHRRVEEWARNGLRNRTQDITNSLGVILRSSGRFGTIPQNRLEAALEEMAKSEGILGIAVLNQDGEVAASAGHAIPADQELLLDEGERWDGDSVTFVNLVDLGTTWSRKGSTETNPVILPDDAEDDGFPGGGGGGGPRRNGPPGGGPPPGFLTGEQLERLKALSDGRVLSAVEVEEVLSMFPEDLVTAAARETIREHITGSALTEGVMHDAMRSVFREHRERRSSPENSDPLFRRPPWINEARWDDLRQNRSAHWFLLTLSNGAYRDLVAQDWWIRALVLVIGALAAGAVLLAWRAIDHFSRLQLRLLRATDLNEYLQEISIAAAGLVHETKNPLNVVRGIAQLLARDASASEAIRSNAIQITEEVDRIAGRLNQFIDYSRPLEVKLAPVPLKPLMEDVRRILENECEDPAITVNVLGPDLTVEADGGLLRQVIFNLLHNAIQAVDEGGTIQMRTRLDSSSSGGFEIEDNGTGVAEDIREEIFKPYFTASGSGSGLGLAVVRQIVLAHQWDIRCEEGALDGARFEVNGMKILVEEA